MVVPAGAEAVGWAEAVGGQVGVEAAVHRHCGRSR